MSGRDLELTALLADWRDGNDEAGKRLMAVAYDHLRRLAAHYLRRERSDHTLQATELVSELYLRLFSSEPVDWNYRVHFFAVAARQLAQSVEIDLLEIDEALAQLEASEPRAAAGVELRFFAGLTETEIADALGISLATLRRDWKFSRAWLLSRLLPTTTHEKVSLERPSRRDQARPR
jgi:RNA polymerase sigma factor (sigma-70 family)